MTKKLAALGLALLLPALASASSSLNPGALQLSGKSSFEWSQRDRTDQDDVTKIGAGLSAMYYVSHFLAFGLAVGYDHEEWDSGGYRSDFLFGPKAGLDWGLMSSLSVFADVTVGITRGETKDLFAPGVTDTGDGFGYELGGGLRLFMNRNVALDLFGAFKQVRLDFPEAGSETTSDFRAGVGISVFLTNNPANAQGYVPPAPAPVYR